MRYETKDTNFLSWAQRINEQNRAVLELMLQSESLLDRLIAQDILQTVVGETNEPK